MRIDRRQVLAGSVMAALALRVGRACGAQGALFVSCRMDAGARHHLTGIDQAGRVRFDLPLPERGHGVAFRPGHDEGVVFAKRPGTFAVAFDPVAGVALRRLDAAAGRRLNPVAILEKVMPCAAPAGEGDVVAAVGQRGAEVAEVSAHAAGVAAALAAREGVAPRQLDVGAVQAELEAQNALIRD